MRKFFVALCILALLGMVGWKLTESWREKKAKDSVFNRTSDAANIEHHISVCGDEWLGYLIFRSPEFRRRLEEEAIAVKFTIEADFQKRFRMLESGECDFVCATIDSFLVNGKSSNYPGVIVFGIDESYGGDAVIGQEEIESVDDLKADTVTGAFVGFSPSEFLLKSQIAHFGIENLTPKLAGFRTDDAASAYAKLKQGSVDFAVLWEPYVSKALAEIPGARRLMDTRQARGIVYDVAIASRKVVEKNPDIVQKVTSAYFDTLNQYLSKPDDFKELARRDGGVSRQEAESMLSGIRFLNILDNREMATGSRDLRMTDAISNLTRILVEVGDLPSDPLGGNPRILVNSQFLSDVGTNGKVAASTPGKVEPIRGFFRKLNDAEWAELYENRAGTLLEKPITFGVGQATIPEEFQADLKTAAQKLIHYPRHRVIVQAHVSPGSDPAADKELSQQRADAIREFLNREAGVVADRIFAVGVGGAEPIAKRDGEGLRAWKRRCRRARIYLAEET